jgi:hypothetical protein
MKTRLHIEKSKLEKSKCDAYDFIYDYFSNHNLSVHESSTHFEIQLLNREDFLYCENVKKELTWLNLQKKDVRNFYIEDKTCFFTLLESWVSYGLSKYLAQSHPNHVTLIHIDDHQDLMPPLLGRKRDQWVDLLTFSIFNFSKPSSVKMAIESGAISIGSMLTPFIHHLKELDVFHIANNSIPTTYFIHPTTINNDIFFPEYKRMSLCLNRTQSSPKKYFRNPELIDILPKMISETNLLLHIDMDFFNNRFNGSTDWYLSKFIHDPPLSDQFKKMDDLCDQLTKSGLASRIQHVSLGISPSFYPCEFWKEGIKYLLFALKSINLPIDYLLYNLYP